MKRIETLVRDIYEVIEHGGGWGATVSRFLADQMESVFQRRLSEDREQQSGGRLRLSQLGVPCTRKLWYSVNKPDAGEPVAPDTKLKFLFGDLLEELVIALCVASGHRVEGIQNELEVQGVLGHRDCVIDGITIDVKTASPASFAKFKKGNLREDDPFGYISQLSSYVYGGRNSDVYSHPTIGAFLVINKVSGEIHLDMYDLSKEIKDKEAEVKSKIEIVSNDTPPDRAFKDEPFQKGGNKALCLQCRYCDFKHECWPGLRTFLSSRGPVYMTKVVKEPRMHEVT